jgi:hypothetical protein
MDLVFPSQVRNGRSSASGAVGEIRLSDGAPVRAVFDPDVDPAEPGDFEAPFDGVPRLLAHLGGRGGFLLRTEIAEEISAAAYDDEDQVSPDQVLALSDDLILVEARFFPDATVLIYRSPAVFAEQDIVVQLTADLETDEIYVA